MVTITEDYVSFEVAKLLKEKGFNAKCNKCYAYFADDDIRCLNLKYPKSAQLLIANRYPCITLQMAMKWLREKGIYITIVYGDYPSLNKVFWTPQIDSLEGFDLPDSFYKEYDKYEEAVEVAIKYCLENLI